MPQGGDRRIDHAQPVLAARESIECRRIGREPHGLAKRCQSLARPSEMQQRTAKPEIQIQRAVP